MESFRVELLPAALEDLKEITDYIMLDNPKAAEETLKSIMKTLRDLEQFPNSGAHIPDKDLRKFDFRMAVSSPYISFYRVIGNTIYIYHIVHGAREYVDLLKPYI